MQQSFLYTLKILWILLLWVSITLWCFSTYSFNQSILIKGEISSIVFWYSSAGSIQGGEQYSLYSKLAYQSSHAYQSLQYITNNGQHWMHGFNKIVFFSNKYYWMNIVNRNRMGRAINKKPSYDFTSIPKESFRRESIPITSIAAMHYAKRQTCPNMHTNNDINQPYPIQDQSTIARISTNGIYDSRKEQPQNITKLDWKILTLKQIKGAKQPTVPEQVIQPPHPKGNHKIFVSISKSNRSISKQKQSVVESRRSAGEPKLSQMGRFRSMSSKRKIVDIVELQMEEIRTNRFFC